MAKKFEYKIISLGASGFWSTRFDWNALTDKLNSLGLQGWEVSGVIDTNGYEGSSKEVSILLKREI